MSTIFQLLAQTDPDKRHQPIENVLRGDAALGSGRGDEAFLRRQGEAAATADTLAAQDAKAAAAVCGTRSFSCKTQTTQAKALMPANGIRRAGLPADFQVEAGPARVASLEQRLAAARTRAATTAGELETVRQRHAEATRRLAPRLEAARDNVAGHQQALASAASELGEAENQLAQAWRGKREAEEALERLLNDPSGEVNEGTVRALRGQVQRYADEIDRLHGLVAAGRDNHVQQRWVTRQAEDELAGLEGEQRANDALLARSTLAADAAKLAVDRLTAELAAARTELSAARD